MTCSSLLRLAKNISINKLVERFNYIRLHFYIYFLTLLGKQGNHIVTSSAGKTQEQGM